MRNLITTMALLALTASPAAMAQTGSNTGSRGATNSAPAREAPVGHRQPRGLEHLPIVLGGLARPGPDDRLAGVVDLFGDPMTLFEAHSRQHPRQRLSDVIEGVVVVVADDHAPVSAQT